MEFGDFLIWFGLIYLAVTIAFGLLEAWLIHRFSRELSEELTSVGQALDEELPRRSRGHAGDQG